MQELGTDCFKDDGGCVGKFWLMLETRPYMRVLRAQVRVYIETKQFDRCAYVISSGSQLLAVFYKLFFMQQNPH